MPDDWTDGDRRRGGVKRTQAFSRNCRNQSFRCQGRSTSGENHEARVPMRSTGADCSVLATKRGNARRAKGAGHSRRDRWVNRKLEEPAGFDGRRQPLLSGTSRMTRECHVRFCEGLGVQFPGSTRPGPERSKNRYASFWRAAYLRMSDCELRQAGFRRGSRAFRRGRCRVGRMIVCAFDLDC